ncbi:MAG: hypothetical protein DAHOPDDO_00838 [Ignavibacteriaceae bacterium]|nr:hypothetical protein [Ignavibacteriaceae bacterium]
MVIASIIGYISTVIWLLPPFRQYKGQYFYFFLILALSDPINLSAVYWFHFQAHIIHSIAGLLLFYSIEFSRRAIKKYLTLHLLIIAGFSISLLRIDNLLYLVVCLHLLILFKFIRIVLTNTFNNNTLNGFNLALSFYELSIVINLSVFLTGNDLMIVIYYMSLSFQFLMAIFFTVFTPKSNFLIIKLKPTE